MGPGRGWGRPQPEPSSCWREGARGAGRGGAAGRGWDTGTGESLSARSWLALGSPGSEQRPFSRLPPSPLPAPLPRLLPPPSLDVDCSPSPAGTRRGPRSPRGRRGGAEGSGPAAQSRARGTDPGRKRRPPPPTPLEVAGLGPRKEGRSGSPGGPDPGGPDGCAGPEWASWCS